MKNKAKKLTITKIVCYVVSVLSLLVAAFSTYLYPQWKVLEEKSADKMITKYEDLKNA